MCKEEGVLWRHIQSFLVCSQKKPPKDLGPGVYLSRERKRVNEQEGKWWTREGLMFGHRQLLSLGSFSAGEHGL